ncbi:MAG: hypothetical protein KUG82_01960 [Pseudomonadales bacterium]|nr:hypothetical protein [Pseudomonadales bacterium]
MLTERNLINWNETEPGLYSPPTHQSSNNLSESTAGFTGGVRNYCEKTIAELRLRVPLILEDTENQFIVTGRLFINELYQELLSIDKRKKFNETTSMALLQDSDDCRRRLCGG